MGARFRRPGSVVLALAAVWLSGCATVGGVASRETPTVAVAGPGGSVCRCESAGVLGATSPSTEPGWRELFVQRTLVEYYVPPRRPGDSARRQLAALVHGAGFCHFAGAVVNIHEWRRWADENNSILISPAFDRGYWPGAPIDRQAAGDALAAGRRGLAGAPCACELNAQCEQFDRYRTVGWAPFFHRAPDLYLWDFVHLTNHANAERADLRLNEIIRLFQMRFDVEERFSLYGYSGGGQFASRYMMLYPERLKRAAAGGAGSFLFPTHDRLFPYGMAGAVGRDHFSREEWDRRLALLLDLPVTIFAGDADFVGVGEHPESAWQGLGQAAIARNFVYALERADDRLKEAGLRPPQAPFKVELVEFPNRNHDEARRDAVARLQEEWGRNP
jgi:pimeloyl-ACP methyl ester carboxylesterase